MATITPATTYPAGALDIAGHNANIFSTTAGQGVLSEPNGGLEQANLDPAFAVRDEHVMSEEAVRATQDSMVLPMDVFSNGFGDSGEDEDSTREKTYVTVAGLSHRVYFPFNARYVMWQWSLFSSVYHPVFFDNQSGFSRDNLIIRAYLDGQPMAAFTRPLVPSAQLLTGIGPPPNNALAEDYEDSTAMWYDFSRLTVNVQEGYHELNIKVYMERNEHSVALVAEGIIPDADDPADTYDYYAHNRITFGVRNVRCVSFA
jgi:hypothetical protein